MVCLVHGCPQRFADDRNFTMMDDALCIDAVWKERHDNRDAFFGLQMKLMEALD